MKIILYSIIAILAMSVTINTNVNAQLVEDRYSKECGIYLLESPEEYLQMVSKEWNYNLSAMPKQLAEEYTCVNWIHIQEGSDKMLSKLGEAITRDND